LAAGVPDRTNRDRGAGLLSTSFGILFFLGFLFFAVQLLFNLYATSVVTSVTYDAARVVATSGHPATQADMDSAEARAKQALGSYATRVRFQWDAYSNPEVVKLRVIAVNPRFLGPAIDTFVGFDVIDRTVEVRVEQFK
jgi:Flp pilus assembly protein TadG